MKKKDLLKNGLWIQKQHGVLTMGSLDETDAVAVELSPELSQAITGFEQDMIEAMYGENAVVFNPARIALKNLFLNVVNEFDLDGVHVSVTCTPDNAVVEAEYDRLFDLLAGFVQYSLDSGIKSENAPAIYLNASLIDDNLCVIYRDSRRALRKDALKKEFDCITNVLHGEVSEKTTPGRGSYIDMVIPVKPVGP